MTNVTGVLYTGVTNDLERRVYQHKLKLLEGFTKRYNINKLVYFESTEDVDVAITREKEIKGWRRSKKVDLINSINPKWQDLSVDWYDSDVILKTRSARRISSH
jgi:putative endonuclease